VRRVDEVELADYCCWKFSEGPRRRQEANEVRERRQELVRQELLNLTHACMRALEPDHRL
jgi:hypothetical protein